METKINIAASQNDNGLFNLVISKVTEIEDQEPVRENVILTELTFESLKEQINKL
jgi:hypothetical protein